MTEPELNPSVHSSLHRLDLIEKTLYIGNGHPSLLAQISDIQSQLDEIRRAIEIIIRTKEERQLSIYRILVEGMMLLVVTLLISYFNRPQPSVVLKVPVVEQSTITPPSNLD